MSLRDELAADLANAVSLYEQSFEWEGDTYACVRRDIPTAMELQNAGGTIDGVNYWLVVPKAVFEDEVFPAQGDLINESQEQIKLVNGHQDPAAVQLILSIGSVDE